jgi:NADH-quinone oxidoreductase subunit J
MPVQVIAFYMLATIAVVAAFAVIAARNPVHSVLFLITTFFSAAGLFVMMGAEFLAMLLVVVYVGAVAVLFLFVVMMLDVDFSKLKQGFLDYLPLGGLVALVLVAEFVIVAMAWQPPPGAPQDVTAVDSAMSNAESIGRVLYTDYILVFQLAGLVLFTAMVGAIVLTLRERAGVRRQRVAAQVGRRREEGYAMTDPKPGEGI